MTRKTRRLLLAQLASVSLLPFVTASQAYAETVTYTYDELGRLRTASYSNGQVITYTYDAAGNRTMLVQTSPGAAPSGTFSAAPSSIAAGAATTLSWTSVNATSASIDNGVGVVTPVAGGAISVSPNTTTTYTLTLSGPGGVTSHQATVTVSGGAFVATINVPSGGPANLRTLANAAGYDGARDANVTFVVASSATVTGDVGAPNGGAGIDSGVWPNASFAITLALQVAGTVQGGGGAGGAGGSGAGDPGSVGGAGGDAILCRLNMGVTVNTGGVVRSGGGGGHGGNGDTSGSSEPILRGGGGGGGGAPSGPGGAAGFSEGSPQPGAGAAGTASAGGAGGSAGGAATSAGSAGGGFASAGGGTPNPAGGAAGFAVRKNGNTVSVTNNGTISGAIS